MKWALAFVMILAGCAQVSECGIQECHGIDVTCGSNVPEACTLEYRLGDFCRQWAECGIVDGSCELLANEKFEQCGNCVVQCNELVGVAAFECEEQCRSILDKL